MRHGKWKRACLAVLVWAASHVPATAQPLNIQPELLQNRYERPADSITFCLNPGSAIVDFDRAIAEALAERLLLTPHFSVIEPEYIVPLDHVIALDEQGLYVALYTQCDALLGFAFPSTQLPSWLTITRPYATTRFILLTADPGIEQLGDIAAGAAIGSRIGSRGDGALLRYNLALPSDKSWQRIPYNNTERIFERTFDRTLAGAIVWEPAYALGLEEGLIDTDIARVLPTAPLDMPMLDFGIVLLNESSFVRTLLDEAIVSLVEDGEVERVARELGLPIFAPVEARF